MDTIDRVTSVLIADLSGSTGLYERLGDREAHALIAGILDQWTRAVQDRAGRVIKTMGDGLLATVDDPADATRVAVDLHRLVDERAGVVRILNAYVAFQRGTVVERGGDIFGDAVNVTARLTELAKPRQILTTAETAKALPGWSIRSLGRTPVRGRTAEVELIELVWEQHLVTTLVVDRPGRESGSAALELTTAGTRVVEPGDCITHPVGAQAASIQPGRCRRRTSCAHSRSTLGSRPRRRRSTNASAAICTTACGWRRS